MRIAYIFDTFPAISETFLAREIAALRRGGCEIEIFALHAGDGASPFLPRGAIFAERALRVLAKNAATRENSFERLGARFGRTLRARNIGWIHAAFASHPATIGRAAARTSGLPFSFSAHARDIFVEGGDLSGKLKDAHFAACCTRAGVAQLRRIAPQHATKVLHLPHGIDTKRYDFVRFSPPPGTLEIFSVGRLVEKKGFDILIDALAIASRTTRGEYSLRAAIIGGGVQRGELQKLIARRGLQRCVTLRGALSPLQTRHAMHAASTRGALFVLPSQVARDGDRDGLPNVLLEAAACGMPLVTTRAGAISEAFDEKSAAFFAAGDASQLARCLLAARFEEKQSRARCETARGLIAANFDVDGNVGALRAAFRGVPERVL